MENHEENQLVELIHSASGKKFRIYLSTSELNRANEDQTFLDEITEKYLHLYERGLTRCYVGDDELDEPQKETELIEISEQRYHWPRAAVLLLLAELEKKKQELLNPHKKRIFFTAISHTLREHGYPVTWEICERKWRGMQTMYKKILNKENISGSGHFHWEFFDAMQEILASDPSYNTPATSTAGISASSSIQPGARGAQDASKKGKCKSKNPDKVQIALGEMHENIKELKTEIQESNRIQLERNKIMDKVANALEKLVNS